MRRRIILTTLGVALLAVLVFSIILVSASSALIVRTQHESAVVDANRVALGIDARLAAGYSVAPKELSGFVRDDALLEVAVPGAAPFVLGEPESDQRVRAESNVGRTQVVVRASGDSFATAALRISAVLILIGLPVALLTVLLGRRLADSLVEPVRDLALVAERLGAGDPRPARRRYGIDELDAVAEVLDASAGQIGEQLATERRLAADVSHQLRTPLTALSMRLEEVLATDDPTVVRNEAAIALQQVERLSSVVDDLLVTARQSRVSQTEVDIDTVLNQQLDEWRRPYLAADRSCRLTGTPGLVAWVSAKALSQVIATLLENSLVHGAGTTTLRTRTSGTSVVIEVADEGPGVPPHLVRRIFDRDVSGASRTGLGLALARAMTEVEGGRLELIQAAPPTFAVFLPVVRPGSELVGEPLGEHHDGPTDAVVADVEGQGERGAAPSEDAASAGSRGNTNVR